MVCFRTQTTAPGDCAAQWLDKFSEESSWLTFLFQSSSRQITYDGCCSRCCTSLWCSCRVGRKGGDGGRCNLSLANKQSASEIESVGMLPVERTEMKAACQQLSAIIWLAILCHPPVIYTTLGTHMCDFDLWLCSEPLIWGIMGM